MEKILTKAIEGGYPSGKHLEMTRKELFLDPEFFQALGKACGWDKCTMYSFSTGKLYLEDEWLYNWHCFIDKLATEGWDKAVSYLLELTNQ